jgi:hypothetical protein
MDGTWGIKGCQWLFGIEGSSEPQPFLFFFLFSFCFFCTVLTISLLYSGIISVLAGLSVYFVLPESPQSAKFLSDSEKSLVLARLQRDRHDGEYILHFDQQQKRKKKGKRKKEKNKQTKVRWKDIFIP